MTTQHYDVAIIGAGAVGLSIAHHLSAHKHVVVLEAESQPAYHSSGRSAAVYIETYENPTVSALTTASHDFFQHPPAGFCEHPLVKPIGGLTAAGPQDEARLEKFVNVWQDVSPRLKVLTAAQARDIVPQLRTDWLSCAAYDPDWMSIDVSELLAGFLRSARQSNASLVTGFEVTNLVRKGKHWHISSLKDSVTADIVVNAAGAWANAIGQLAGTNALPLTPMRRTAAIVPAPNNATDWPLVHTIDEELYFKPESPGLMVSPQDETPTPPSDAQPEELDIAVTLDRLAKIADLDTTRVLHSWAGLRTFAPDRRPVLGYDPTVENFFWSAGQGGFGIQTAPGLGALAANCILGAKPDSDVDLKRFASTL